MKKILTTIVILILMAQSVVAGEYVNARKAADKGELDFAFMHYRKLLRENPHSRFKHKAFFALGEYYYLNSGRQKASEYFHRYIETEPDSLGVLFALVYLLKMAKDRDDQKQIKDLEQKIITLKKQSFVFKEFKSYKYKSPLNRQYVAVYSIDRIEFYVDEKRFESITIRI